MALVVTPILLTKILHGWIRTGQDKVLATTGSRSRLKYCALFLSTRDSYPLENTLHILLDGARYHRSDLVRDTAFVLIIELHYLTPYSLTERLLKVMNEKSLNNVYFKRKSGFKVAINQIFTVILSEIASSLAYRINDNFQMFNPASSS